MTARATLYLLTGLPAAGKTTAARALERDTGALRLTPDEWMLPLFGKSFAGGKRDVLEGRLIWVALKVLQAGTSVILDFGFWARDERSSLVWLAEAVGASADVLYFDVAAETQLERARNRFSASPEDTFEMPEHELASWRHAFEVPGADELAGTFRPPAPGTFQDWSGWASERWPSLPLLADLRAPLPS
jgi:predicted kinase